MDFLLYLTPQSQDILNQIYKKKYSVRENIGLCRTNKDTFGYANYDKKFVICTNNIKESNFDLKFYINETIYHEAVHVAHFCNGFRPFGISPKLMKLSSWKYNDIKNSVNMANTTSRIEHEAYWMEDKPEKVKYVLQKYCF